MVLGSSGWLGHYLIPALRQIAPNAEIIAFYRSRLPIFYVPGVEVVKFPIELGDLTGSIPSGTVINLNRGETEHDFELHKTLIDLQNQRRSRYLYASSFNAVDADVSNLHTEDQAAIARSPYGIFKARCETELLKRCERPLAFRFSSTHGWAPNREARTQVFLGKLSAGEKIKVKTGVIQNRLFVGDLALQIAMLAIEERLEGVFHLGTSDFSEEIEFLRNLAVEFGYDPKNITKGEDETCNAVMLVSRFTKMFPKYSLPSERDTIRKVGSQLELAAFKRLSVGHMILSKNQN